MLFVKKSLEELTGLALSALALSGELPHVPCGTVDVVEWALMRATDGKPSCALLHHGQPCGLGPETIFDIIITDATSLGLRAFGLDFGVAYTWACSRGHRITTHAVLVKPENRRAPRRALTPTRAGTG